MQMLSTSERSQSPREAIPDAVGLAQNVQFLPGKAEGSMFQLGGTLVSLERYRPPLHPVRSHQFRPEYQKALREWDAFASMLFFKSVLTCFRCKYTKHGSGRNNSPASSTAAGLEEDEQPLSLHVESLGDMLMFPFTKLGNPRSWFSVDSAATA